MEKLVENWLNKNPEWFESYVLERLDLKTIEKWLKLNDKRICKCKLDDDFTLNNTHHNQNHNHHHQNKLIKIPDTQTTTTTNNVNKNSLIINKIPKSSSFNSTSNMTLQTDKNHVPIINGSNDIDHNNNNNNNTNKQSISNSKSTNNLNNTKETKKFDTSHDTTLQIMNKLYRSHSYTCVIHNKRVAFNAKRQNSNEGFNIPMSACHEELNSDDNDSENNVKSESINSADDSGRVNEKSLNGLSQYSLSSSPNNSNTLHNCSASSPPLAPPPAMSAFNSARKNSFNSNTLDALSNNLISINIGKKNLMTMRKYHTLYSYDSATSLNILKYLIESKIKLPQRLNSSSFADKYKLLSNDRKPNMEFLIELIKDISCELCLKTLSEKIINNLKLLVNAEKASLFFVCQSRQCLASFKYDPHTGSTDMHNNSNNNCNNNNNNNKLTSNHHNKHDNDFKDLSNDNFELEMPFGSSIIGQVASSGNLLNIPYVQKDKRYNLIKDGGIEVKSLLCIPIKNFENEVIAVAQVINKCKQNNNETNNCNSNNNSNNKSNGGFDENDIILLNTYLPFCGYAIVHAQLFDLYAYEYDRNRALLEVVHDLFEQQTNLDAIVFRIMQKAQALLKCQRCSVLLILDKDDQTGQANSRKAFDLFQSGNRPGQRRHSVEDDDGTKISRNLADYVIITGNKINLSDAYSDTRFDPLVDTVWKFKTKSLLCMPIRNRDSNIIGCAQIANRLDNQPFDENDELLFEAFCIFCGLGINNTLIYNQLEKSMAEKSVALEVLSYHASCSKSELNKFLDKYPNEENFSQMNKNIRIDNLSSFVYDDFSLNSDEMILASYEMFKASGLMRTFQIEKQTLVLWLMSVRKNYRNVEYHNWNHAFNVCQSMFAIFSNSKINNYLQDIEKLALIVGCLCHDLDHRGTNNSFQAESHSALSQLYGTTATLEKHHFNHCVMILNTPGHNIFSHLRPRTYALVMSYIKEAILATDLADHFSIRRKFDEAIENKDIYWGEEPWCTLLRKVLMTCCDLNAVTKPWPTHRSVVNLVTKEFFAQGDRERLELNIEPQEMMDVRRSHELPRLQIGWIDNVCMPLYRNVSILCDSFKGHLVRIEDNRKKWSNLSQLTSPSTVLTLSSSSSSFTKKNSNSICLTSADR